MSGLKTIVAATDLSPASASALRHAAALAGRTGATLHLLFAHLLFRSDGVASGEHAESVLRLRVERFARETLGSCDAIQIAVERGISAPEVIHDYVSEVDADALVMGTHGRTGIGRILLGSVAERCVGQAPCPVLVVPADAPLAYAASAPVLVPVDFSERSLAALAVGREMAAHENAPLHVVHIARDTSPYPDLSPDYIPLSTLNPREETRLRDRLIHLAPEAEAPGFEGDGAPTPEASGVHVLMGSPARVLPHLAEKLGARLLVMGTHGRRGAAHALLGSVAEATLRRATCPVLTLRTADLAKPKTLTRTQPA